MLINIIITSLSISRTFDRTNAKRGQTGQLARAGFNSRYVTASELSGLPLTNKKRRSKVECMYMRLCRRYLHTLEHHMKHERETCGHEGEIEER